MIMSEFWYYRESKESEAKKFMENKSEPDYDLSYSIGERDFVNTGKASSEIKLALKRLGVDNTILRRVAIAVYEAEINVTAHSRGGNIIANIYDNCVHVVFKDNGPGMKDINQSMEPGFSTADEMIREMGFGAGLGLPNIKKNADVLHIESQEGANTFLELVIFYE